MTTWTTKSNGDTLSGTEANYLNDNVPIGTIMAWAKSLTGTPSLPAQWAECDGSTVSDAESVYDGVTLPSLNSGTQRFLRGSTTSGTTGGAETHTHSDEPFNDGSLTTHTVSDNAAANHLPPYYEVVWIIRIK